MACSYISEMAQYIPISNAGSCDIAGVKSERSPSRWGGDWYSSKNSVVSRFPFYLAFENRSESTFSQTCFLDADMSFCQ